MPLIKLSATDSTSTYLKELHRRSSQPDYTVVLTHNQTKGRGQLYSQWVSDPGKNLTFSVLKLFQDLSKNRQFLITIMVSLALYNVLKHLKVPNITIKWPNDIMSGSKKIGGILIENTLLKGQIEWTVIGVGLNVNQVGFPNGLNANSLQNVLGHEMDLDALLEKILGALRHHLEALESAEWHHWYPIYYQCLYRKEVVSTFKTPTGQHFSGIITGVAPNGQLCLTLENDELRYFGLKELKLLN